MSQSPLLNLPSEIRNLIYTYHFTLVEDDSPGEQLYDHYDRMKIYGHLPLDSLEVPIPKPSPTSTASPHAAFFSALPPLCRTCRQLYWETRLIFLSKARIILPNATATKSLQNWLSTFPQNTAFHAIAHLDLQDFAMWADGTDHELLFACPDLETLRLTFLRWPQVMPPEIERTLMHQYDPRILLDSVRFLIEAWNLGTLFELKMRRLKVLVIRNEFETVGFYAECVVRVGLAKAFAKAWRCPFVVRARPSIQ